MRIEPTISFPVIGKARDIPMLDEFRIGNVHCRAAADEDDAIRERGNRVGGSGGGSDLGDGAFGIGEARHRAFRARPHQDDVSARHVPEPRDVRDEFRPPIPFPRQLAAQTELAEKDRAAGKDDI